MIGCAGGPAIESRGRRFHGPGGVLRWSGLAKASGQPGFASASRRPAASVTMRVQGQWGASRRIVRRPVVAIRAAVENSRRRRFLGSQRRSSPVRASIGIQASRSRASWMISSQTWFCAVVCSRLRRPVSRVARTRSSAGPQPVAQFERGDRPVGGVGGSKQGHAVAVHVGEPQLRSGVRAFLLHDQPHARAAGRQARRWRARRPRRRRGRRRPVRRPESTPRLGP